MLIFWAGPFFASFWDPLCKLHLYYYYLSWVSSFQDYAQQISAPFQQMLSSSLNIFTNNMMYQSTVNKVTTRQLKIGN
jgi:hypothetical protein